MEDIFKLDSDFDFATLQCSDLESYGRAKAAFGYYGSKQRLAPRILELLPPHNCWVELFCGSAAITLAKQAAPIEIINDLDKNIVNVFKQLRESPDELIRQIELTPYAREEFRIARSREEHVSDLERARRFLVEAMMSINGVMAGSKGSFSLSDSYSRGKKEARVNRWYNYPQRLNSVVSRIRNTRIENLDALDLLAKFVYRPATLVYIDPPYLINRASKYQHDAPDKEFHERLLDTCNQANCMILISGYETPLYNQLLSAEKGWKKEIIATHTKGTSGTMHARNEVVWINGVAAEALDSGKCIEFNQKELKLGKINPERNNKD